MHRHAFTLIELLMVIAIMAMLTAMLSPIVRMAQRTSQKTQIQALLRRVDLAVRLFREDVGTYPYQDHTSGSLDANRLAWQLSRILSTDERDRLRTDLDNVGKAYAIGGSQALTTADIDPGATIYDPYKSSNQTDVTAADRSAGQRAHVAAVNRLAAERARLAILAGNTAVTGIGPHTGDAVIAATSAGWCDDYLTGDLAPRERSSDGVSILDPRGEPVRYICPVIAGVRGFWPSKPMEAVHSGNVSIPIRVEYYGLDTISRRTATTVMDSDRTDSAPARLIDEPELWSAGADRLISIHRNAPENRDNVPAAPYDKELR
jgi:prepilin-type N-terminal cleavage/methylation domain-containing protein